MMDAVNQLPLWKALENDAAEMKDDRNHLNRLIEDKDRLSWTRLKAAAIRFDFSRQRLTRSGLERLRSLARERNVLGRFRAMVSGEKVNTTEKRAALHLACRDFSGSSVMVEAEDVMPRIAAVREKIKRFSEAV